MGDNVTFHLEPPDPFDGDCTALGLAVLLTYKDAQLSCERSSFPFLRSGLLRSGLLHVEIPRKLPLLVVE